MPSQPEIGSAASLAPSLSQARFPQGRAPSLSPAASLSAASHSDSAGPSLSRRLRRTRPGPVKSEAAPNPRRWALPGSYYDSGRHCHRCLHDERDSDPMVTVTEPETRDSGFEAQASQSLFKLVQPSLASASKPKTSFRPCDPALHYCYGIEVVNHEPS